MASSAAFTYREESVKKDNDTSGTDFNGFSYITGSQHYNNDARIANSYYDSYWYLWTFTPVTMYPTQSGFGKLWIKLHLNSSSFDDITAIYSIELDDTTLGTHQVIDIPVDQRAAPAGWSGSTFYTKNSLSNHPYFIKNHVYTSSVVDLTPSGDFGHNAGADGVQLVYKYN